MQRKTKDILKVGTIIAMIASIFVVVFVESLNIAFGALGFCILMLVIGVIFLD